MVDYNIIQRVKRVFTNQIPKLRNLTYEDRLNIMHLKKFQLEETQ